MYYLVFPAKYRRKVFSETVEASLRDICLGIGDRHLPGGAGCKVKTVRPGLKVVWK